VKEIYDLAKWEAKRAGGVLEELERIWGNAFKKASLLYLSSSEDDMETWDKICHEYSCYCKRLVILESEHYDSIA